MSTHTRQLSQNETLEDTICEFLALGEAPFNAASMATSHICKSLQYPRKLKDAKMHELDEHRFEDPNLINYVQPSYSLRLKSFFSTLYAVNKSFSGPLGRISQLNKTELILNFDLVEKFYKFVMNMNDKYPDDKLVDSALDSMCEILSHVSSEITFYQNPIQLRFLLVFLEAPFLEDDCYVTLTKIVSTIDALESDGSHQSDPKAIIQSWYEQMPLANLDKHLSLVQQMLTVKISEAEIQNGLRAIYNHAAPIIKHSLGFLRIIYKANCQRELKCLPATTYLNFTNDAINSLDLLIDIEFDLMMSKNGRPEFNLLENAFALDSERKAHLLKRHAASVQTEHVQNSLLQIFSNDHGDASPILVLRVSRENLVRSTLYTLAEKRHNPVNFKKPLKVIFDGEQGVDEGGVAKEFFQLLVQELFNPDYGMFIQLNDSRYCWFNMNSLETSSEFELIGIILGLAIYNGVILDVHFPLAVYKKLLNLPLNINDLREFQPELATSVDSVMNMNPDELEMSGLTFSVSYEWFGEALEVALGGYDIEKLVTIENRQEFADLFINWHLQESIKQQFDEFNKGFKLCCDTPILKMFRAEDLHLSICGSEKLDFNALEKATKYQYGFSKDSETIKDFWEIAHEYKLEDKRKLLMFITGSDRAPINGLASMPFIIGKNGPDSDKIPTAHTCFNFFLLPDYKNKEKLRKLLRIAIDNCHGFGLR